ncbi:MAG: UDP-3-O-(3-hydroxymyristoyl)glucosamine N-acyltransferase [Myxococcales bacterium]|nr:UDP-3-O-(3-hydroxymyristoyl)glucosamine N-acyltransferase [Myxococcales bacterium]MDH5567655.1 UDP-3-O-(3-hydroxymyristoyl)glucosamine N-acyltransferase [Myxococcales bacterium]
MSPTRIRLKDLAAQLGLEVEGDPDLALAGVASLEDAGPEQLSFVRSERLAAQLAATRAGALVAPAGLDVGGRPVLRSTDPSRDFFRAARILVPEPQVAAGIDPSARVAEDAEVHPSASVAAGCVLGRGVVVGARSVLHPGVVLTDGARVGEDCLIHARCVIAAASVLGDRVILQPGVVIGGDGFGYVGEEGGGRRKVHNIGRVVLEDDVEIGANTTVDRGTLGDTRIGRGTKIDNLVQIAHNCQIGARVLIAAQVGVAGSSRIEDDCVLLGQVGVSDHRRVGPRALVGAGTGVASDVPPDSVAFGYPNRPGREWHRESAALKRLPELLRRVRALERWMRDRGGES